ncbi:MAG: methyl-accepting chemotaxis protein [Oscillospiraceae bacterium]|jgi:methyl-accepting chemotaxis protein|nr:methyl-accepting chemotaxis protein [Oscillospiraceae bacterium]
MSFKLKMALSVILSVVAVIAVWLVTARLDEEVAIGSEYYDEILLANELIADVLPPPEYVIESYAYALRYEVTNDAAEREDIVANMTTLQETYNERNVYWQTAIPEFGSLNEVFVQDAYRYGTEFFNAFFERVVPAVHSGNDAEISAAYDALQQSYQSHREMIDETVRQANDYWAKVLSDADSAAANVERMLTIAVIAIAAVLAGLCLYITISMSVSLGDVIRVTKGIADGNLKLSIKEKLLRGRDEMGAICRNMQSALNQLNLYQQYIDEMALVLGSMSEGKLNTQLHGDYAGDFARLKQAFLRFQATMTGTLELVIDSSGRVDSSATQIASGSTNLATGASMQAASMQELNATMADIKSRVSQAADSARNARGVANEALSGAERGERQMERMMTAIGEIGEASERISENMKLIDDIAFNTNILALNASIEAARAGVHGKGFAVVAEEVRSLANQSAEAGNEISRLIEGAVSKVHEGVEIAEDANKTFMALAELVRTVTSSVTEIDEATKQQQMSIAQVTVGMDQISSVIQTNAATAEESSAASAQLASQAAALDAQLAIFK